MPPSSLSQNGMLITGIKSQRLDILEQSTNVTYDEPPAETVTTDGAAMVNAKHPGQQKHLMFKSKMLSITPHIESNAERYIRVDVVFDINLTEKGFWCLEKGRWKQ